MSINSVAKVTLGVFALVAVAYGVRRILFHQTHHSMAQNAIAAQAVASCKDDERIKKLEHSVDVGTDLNSSYSISIPLLGAAYSNNRELYERWQEAMFTAFGIKSDLPTEAIVEKMKEKPSENAWILGRLLVANLQMGDKESARKIAAVIEGLLLQQTSVDPFVVWAWGYLAIFYAQDKADEYPRVKEKMINCTNELIEMPGQKGKDNVHWAIVMELQSLAEMKDQKSYEERLQKLQDFSEKSSMVEALETIPPGDFRAWATSLILHAAKKMKDRSLVYDLTKYLPTAMSKSPSDGDKMLALLIQCA